MVLSSNISKNTVKVYHVDDFPLKKTERVFSVDLYQWREDLPKKLSELCIQTIADNWRENPIVNELPLLSDVINLIDILSTDLPLELTVPNIAYETYWLRCYKSRWPKNPSLGRNFSEIEKLHEDRKVVVKSTSSSLANLSQQCSKKSQLSRIPSRASSFSMKSDQILGNSSSKSDESIYIKNWKALYLEMYLQDYLENLEPEQYDPEKIKNIASLCESYVTVLTLKELKTPTSKEVPDHIPLSAILTDFRNLKELCLCYKQRYVGEKFSWHIFNTTMVDIKNLAKGLENTRLEVLRIKNCDVNCTKVKMLLKGMSRNDSLKEMEFSHCKIADHGTMAIAKYIQDHSSIVKLNLVNNYIGFEGTKSLAYLLMNNGNLKCLDIRLNIINSKGGKYLWFALTKGTNELSELVIAGCGLNNRNVEVEEFLLSNKTLERLDLSNNRMGEDIGKLMLKGIRFNKSIIHLDCRRCEFEASTEYEISSIAFNNKHKKHSREVCWDKPEFQFSETIEEIFADQFIDDFNSVLSE